MEDFNIYEDLEEEERQKAEEEKRWRIKYETALQTIETIEIEKKELSKKNKQLEINFTRLLDTARTEIERKNNIIADLYKQIDNFQQLKYKTPGNYSKFNNNRDKNIRYDPGGYQRNYEEGGHKVENARHGSPDSQSWGVEESYDRFGGGRFNYDKDDRKRGDRKAQRTRSKSGGSHRSYDDGYRSEKIGHKTGGSHRYGEKEESKPDNNSYKGSGPVDPYQKRRDEDYYNRRLDASARSRVDKREGNRSSDRSRDKERCDRTKDFRLTKHSSLSNRYDKEDNGFRRNPFESRESNRSYAEIRRNHHDNFRHQEGSHKLKKGERSKNEKDKEQGRSSTTRMGDHRSDSKHVEVLPSKDVEKHQDKHQEPLGEPPKKEDKKIIQDNEFGITQASIKKEVKERIKKKATNNDVKVEETKEEVHQKLADAFLDAVFEDMIVEQKPSAVVKGIQEEANYEIPTYEKCSPAPVANSDIDLQPPLEIKEAYENSDEEEIESPPYESNPINETKYLSRAQDKIPTSEKQTVEISSQPEMLTLPTDFGIVNGQSKLEEQYAERPRHTLSGHSGGEVMSMTKQINSNGKLNLKENDRTVRLREKNNNENVQTVFTQVAELENIVLSLKNFTKSRSSIKQEKEEKKELPMDTNVETILSTASSEESQNATLSGSNLVTSELINQNLGCQYNTCEENDIISIKSNPELELEREIYSDCKSSHGPDISSTVNGGLEYRNNGSKEEVNKKLNSDLIPTLTKRDSIDLKGKARGREKERKLSEGTLSVHSKNEKSNGHIQEEYLSVVSNDMKDMRVCEQMQATPIAILTSTKRPVEGDINDNIPKQESNQGALKKGSVNASKDIQHTASVKSDNGELSSTSKHSSSTRKTKSKPRKAEFKLTSSHNTQQSREIKLKTSEKIENTFPAEAVSPTSRVAGKVIEYNSCEQGYNNDLSMLSNVETTEKQTGKNFFKKKSLPLTASSESSTLTLNHSEALIAIPKCYSNENTPTKYSRCPQCNHKTKRSKSEIKTGKELNVEENDNRNDAHCGSKNPDSNDLNVSTPNLLGKQEETTDNSMAINLEGIPKRSFPKHSSTENIEVSDFQLNKKRTFICESCGYQFSACTKRKTETEIKLTQSVTKEVPMTLNEETNIDSNVSCDTLKDHQNLITQPLTASGDNLKPYLELRQSTRKRKLDGSHSTSTTRNSDHHSAEQIKRKLFRNETDECPNQITLEMQNDIPSASKRAKYCTTDQKSSENCNKQEKKSKQNLNKNQPIIIGSSIHKLVENEETRKEQISVTNSDNSHQLTLNKIDQQPSIPPKSDKTRSENRASETSTSNGKLGNEKKSRRKSYQNLTPKKLQVQEMQMIDECGEISLSRNFKTENESEEGLPDKGSRNIVSSSNNPSDSSSSQEGLEKKTVQTVEDSARPTGELILESVTYESGEDTKYATIEGQKADCTSDQVIRIPRKVIEENRSNDLLSAQGLLVPGTAESVTVAKTKCDKLNSAIVPDLTKGHDSKKDINETSLEVCDNPAVVNLKHAKNITSVSSRNEMPNSSKATEDRQRSQTALCPDGNRVTAEKINSVNTHDSDRKCSLEASEINSSNNNNLNKTPGNVVGAIQSNDLLRTPGTTNSNRAMKKTKSSAQVTVKATDLTKENDTLVSKKEIKETPLEVSDLAAKDVNHATNNVSVSSTKATEDRQKNPDVSSEATERHLLSKDYHTTHDSEQKKYPLEATEVNILNSGKNTSQNEAPAPEVLATAVSIPSNKNLRIDNTEPTSGSTMLCNPNGSQLKSLVTPKKRKPRGEDFIAVNHAGTSKSPSEAQKNKENSHLGLNICALDQNQHDAPSSIIKSNKDTVVSKVPENSSKISEEKKDLTFESKPAKNPKLSKKGQNSVARASRQLVTKENLLQPTNCDVGTCTSRVRRDIAKDLNNDGLKSEKSTGIENTSLGQVPVYTFIEKVDKSVRKDEKRKGKDKNLALSSSSGTRGCVKEECDTLRSLSLNIKSKNDSEKGRTSETLSKVTEEAGTVGISSSVSNQMNDTHGLKNHKMYNFIDSIPLPRNEVEDMASQFNPKEPLTHASNLDICEIKVKESTVTSLSRDDLKRSTDSENVKPIENNNICTSIGNTSQSEFKTLNHKSKIGSGLIANNLEINSAATLEDCGTSLIQSPNIDSSQVSDIRTSLGKPSIFPQQIFSHKDVANSHSDDNCGMGPKSSNEVGTVPDCVSIKDALSKDNDTRISETLLNSKESNMSTFQEKTKPLDGSLTTSTQNSTSTENSTSVEQLNKNVELEKGVTRKSASIKPGSAFVLNQENYGLPNSVSANIEPMDVNEIEEHSPLQAQMSCASVLTTISTQVDDPLELMSKTMSINCTSRSTDHKILDTVASCPLAANAVENTFKDGATKECLLQTANVDSHQERAREANLRLSNESSPKVNNHGKMETAKNILTNKNDLTKEIPSPNKLVAIDIESTTVDMKALNTSSQKTTQNFVSTFNSAVDQMSQSQESMKHNIPKLLGTHGEVEQTFKDIVTAKLLAKVGNIDAQKEKEGEGANVITYNDTGMKDNFSAICNKNSPREVPQSRGNSGERGADALLSSETSTSSKIYASIENLQKNEAKKRRKSDLETDSNPIDATSTEQEFTVKDQMDTSVNKARNKVQKKRIKKNVALGNSSTQEHSANHFDQITVTKPKNEKITTSTQIDNECKVNSFSKLSQVQFSSPKKLQDKTIDGSNNMELPSALAKTKIESLNSNKKLKANDSFRETDEVTTKDQKTKDKEHFHVDSSLDIPSSQFLDPINNGDSHKLWDMAAAGNLTSTTTKTKFDFESKSSMDEQPPMVTDKDYITQDINIKQHLKFREKQKLSGASSATETRLLKICDESKNSDNIFLDKKDHSPKTELPQQKALNTAGSVGSTLQLDNDIPPEVIPNISSDPSSVPKHKPNNEIYSNTAADNIKSSPDVLLTDGKQKHSDNSGLSEATTEIVEIEIKRKKKRKQSKEEKHIMSIDSVPSQKSSDKYISNSSVSDEKVVFTPQIDQKDKGFRPLPTATTKDTISDSSNQTLPAEIIKRNISDCSNQTRHASVSSETPDDQKREQSPKKNVTVKEIQIKRRGKKQKVSEGSYPGNDPCSQPNMSPALEYPINSAERPKEDGLPQDGSYVAIKRKRSPSPADSITESDLINQPMRVPTASAVENEVSSSQCLDPANSTVPIVSSIMPHELNLNRSMDIREELSHESPADEANTSQLNKSSSSRKVSIGSNEYVIETVGVNTANVYISRRRYKKRIKTSNP